MEIEHTFDTEPAEGAWRDGLLACCQHFLGHDLPNRLVAAQGLARLLVADAADRLDAEGRDLLLQIADLVRDADVDARRLADLGRLLRAGELAGPFALDDLVREAVAEAGLTCVEYRLPDALPPVLAPRRAARRAVAELLRNAAAASPAVAVAAEAAGADVLCRVADRGPGLTADELGRLAALLAGGLPPGPGSGWFAVREAVSAWGGSVRVRCEPGRGTAVTLVFRAAT